MLQILFPVLSEILGLCRSIKRRVKFMQADIDALRVELADTKTVAASAVTLIENLITRIEGAADDGDEIRSITAEFRASKAALANSVAAGTSAMSEPAADENPAGGGDTGTGGDAGTGTGTGDEPDTGEEPDPNAPQS